MQTQEYVVRANRGRARVWIEGARLIAAGFTVGARFCIGSHDDGALVIILTPEGSRKVSGKGARPIIDLAGKSCAPFETGDAVKITYKKGAIVITPEAK